MVTGYSRITDEPMEEGTKDQGRLVCGIDMPNLASTAIGKKYLAGGGARRPRLADFYAEYNKDPFNNLCLRHTRAKPILLIRLPFR